MVLLACLIRAGPESRWFGLSFGIMFRIDCSSQHGLLCKILHNPSHIFIVHNWNLPSYPSCSVQIWIVASPKDSCNHFHSLKSTNGVEDFSANVGIALLLKTAKSYFSIFGTGFSGLCARNTLADIKNFVAEIDFDNLSLRDLRLYELSVGSVVARCLVEKRLRLLGICCRLCILTIKISASVL